MAIAKTISDIGAEIKIDRKDNADAHGKLFEKLDSIDIETLNAITQSYNGILTARGIVNSLAKFVLSLGAIGVGVAYIIRMVK